MVQQREDWELPGEASSIPRARTLMTQRLRDLPDDCLEVVLLLTSELVTNAVRHGGGPVGLHATWGVGGVRVEADERSPERPVLRAVDRDALNGRGLMLIDDLSSGWGVLP